MRPAEIELGQPSVEIGLQFVDRPVELLTEGDAVMHIHTLLSSSVEFALIVGIENSLVGALA